MTGLEKIIMHIGEDAIATAKVVITEAKSKAGEITTAAQAECNKKRADIEEQSKIEVQACLSRAESSALLQEKKLILNAKQQIISTIITSSKNLLAKLPSEEYFDVMIKMIKKYALGQSGQILFSAIDKKRLPEQFGAILQTALLEIEGAALTVSENTREMDGGFVLIYGDVEENCSFDALFFAARESLQDKVCEVLFV